MRVLKFIGRGVLAVVGLVVLLYLILLAGNWNDQPPSAAALRLDAIIAARPQVPARENAIVYLLGFDAPLARIPMKLARAAWRG